MPAAAISAELPFRRPTCDNRPHCGYEGGMTMPRLSTFTLVAIAAMMFVAAAGASAPVHIRALLSITEPSPEYSAACGFPVLLTAEGMLDVTVHANPDGSVREEDVFPGLTITVSAPSTGRSFSHIFGPTTYFYPDGVYVGASAVITSYGMRGDVPGIPPDAGRVVTPGVVVAIVPDIGPITLPTGPPVAQSGNFEDPARIVAAICAALSA
jgi:hypothetical protein